MYSNPVNMQLELDDRTGSMVTTVIRVIMFTRVIRVIRLVGLLGLFELVGLLGYYVLKPS